MRGLFLALGLAGLSGPAFAQSVSAVLEPAQLVALQPSNVGRLSDVSVEEGQDVEQGSVLARLDDRVQTARVAVAERAASATGGEDRARIVVSQAENRLDRIKRARSKGAVQAWEVRQAELTLNLAKADLRLAEESAEQLDTQMLLEQQVLSSFAIQAPFDGTVLRVLAEPGEIVGPDTPILELGNLSDLKATVFVPVDWVSRLSVQQTVSVDVQQDPTVTVNAVIGAIDPRVDPASRSVRITLDVPNSDQALLPGSAIVMQAP